MSRRQRWECVTTRLHINARDFTCTARITDGYCTEADPAIAYAKGASWPWLWGHLIHQGWTWQPLAEQMQLAL